MVRGILVARHSIGANGRTWQKSYAAAFRDHAEYSSVLLSQRGIHMAYTLLDLLC